MRWHKAGLAYDTLSVRNRFALSHSLGYDTFSDTNHVLSKGLWGYVTTFKMRQLAD